MFLSFPFEVRKLKKLLSFFFSGISELKKRIPEIQNLLEKSKADVKEAEEVEAKTSEKVS